MLSRFKSQSGFTLVKTALITVILLGIGGVVFLSLPWKTGPNSPPSFRFNEHKLVVASHSALRQFEYNPSDQDYKKQMTATFPELMDIDTVVKTGDNFFLASDQKVVKLNSEFQELTSKKFEKVGALATDGETIFVSAENSIIAFDQNLNELSRAKLDADWAKNAHDILVHGDTAYLLDDLMFPVFLFRVNIANPGDIRITEKIDFTGINPHLDGQWLNPKLKQWLVVHSSSRSGGGSQSITTYPMKEGDEPIFDQTIFSYSQKLEQLPVPYRGVEVKAVTDLAPVWAVVQTVVQNVGENVKKKHHLAQIERKDSKLSFSNVLRLEGIKANEEVIMEKQESQQGNYLFVAAEGGLIKVIVPEPQPEVILSQVILFTDVGEVTDILTY